ncbi:MAG: CopG family transcriptional regulator [bacterium (Candidatus Ratteibacteria) CG_4_10_14_3_um_filter_41_18]|uniref:CopG family transcriptional regulator n=4 Tax=Candidatus Ratteibacteria TaxID=2979319 RepID=A0A2M7E6X8_9BACT|nr:MAG: hypothetical protein AUJ76_03560 [Candidatus Omnitrophica bacterium CG1_02_41_171]PIV63474.1 MAG: CopG family transcriptional regulator [bacterium (Candidatus Ratteibacteria) CG01_land_8_20_14_3_00_40_19]PIW34168.1 MAG: CopG family transcriptional regulator [bacterium (Candidatus Ratteibacteria) CG15_BIG_FIL_POST_REV_8_21_14_020_41_12]PIW73795.1 MAG: CopG family transcriptional regulator [bacterium (Candidatus Ratteibacteria) CG_4_8_14_3_um_filter_41_36]PIX76761.1 MAG: CopG family trans
MGRTTEIVSLSFPKKMVEQIDKMTQEEGKTRSEFFRETVRQYIEDREWKKIFRYGEIKARELNITDENDVECLIDEYRTERKKS